MKLQTIGQVASQFNVSARTLRYYEQIGLIAPAKNDDNAYRMYNEDAIVRMRQIIILRKLRIPLKQIADILKSGEAKTAIEAFERNLADIDSEITALSTIREIIAQFIKRLNKGSGRLALLEDENLLEIVDSLTVSKINFKEEKAMGDLNKTDTVIKGKFDEVKYVNLTPARAVAFNYVSREPEDEAYLTVKRWIDKNNLQGTARMFLFNIEPYPSEESLEYGMGCCATIPEGIDIPAPLYEMRLPGGTYAVISEYEGDPSYGWKKIEALMHDPAWEWEYDAERHPGLEEHIERTGGGFIIPILFPVKKK